MSFHVIFSIAQTVDQNKVRCSTKEIKIEGSEDPEIIETCIWRSYKSIEESYPNPQNGNYSYSENKIFKLINGKYVQIKKAQLFNQNKSALLSVLNKKVKKYYEEISKDPESSDCLVLISSAPVLSFEDFNISFNDKGISFSFSLGLSSACLSVDGDIISFTFKEIDTYLNK